MSFLRLAVLSTLTASALASGPAGNENYQLHARSQLRSLSVLNNKLTARDTFSPIDLSLEQTSYTFKISDGTEDKVYISPAGEKHKKYSLAVNGLASLKQQAPSNTLVPVTVFDVGEQQQVTCDTMGNAVSEYLSSDDVWNELILATSKHQAFMKTILLKSTSTISFSADLHDCLSTHWGTSVVLSTAQTQGNLQGINVKTVSGQAIPSGPYIASYDVANDSINLTEVFRLYRDQEQAFTTPLIPLADSQTFSELATQVGGMSTMSIPVPSRLYTKYLANPRPLEGVRVVVKDLYDIKGVPTGCGNRAYWLTYEPRNATAVSIQRLIDQGAVIIGKAKTSQFANGETPTADWQDQFSPFNIRGDGYQDPSTSSAGSGASIGAYDWVDVTIGSDTGGSVRDPAANNGAYGIRPSHGAISLEGVMPMSSPLDTAGFLTRDAKSFAEFGKAWYGSHFQSYDDAKPKTIFVPNDYFPLSSDANPAAQPIYDAFIDSLQSYLNATIDTRSFADIWNSSGTMEQTQQTIPSYLNETYATLIGYYQWTHFGQPWFADYALQHDGRTPFIDSQPAVRWAYGRQRGEAGYEAELAKKNVFKDFFSTHVLKADNETCTDALFLYPINTGTTSYRNGYKSAPSPPFGIFNEAYAPFHEGPEISIPLSQVPYNSTITNHVEYLPVSVAIMARPGCDYVLFDLAAGLQDAGIISATQTGPEAYPIR
ncbi:hypothetical protein QFC19_001684 [Naganishia cerealis]|uniref:Uncharacterized protein n=1 Tax=Naganishia cerealis TaxID=610337 RepID=A0ACC2WGT9_9TREE|nr:hypothetical protein QFC19_001684 [Naganishia cerealis]